MTFFFVIFGFIALWGFIGLIYPTPWHKKLGITKTRPRNLAVWVVASLFAAPFIPDTPETSTAAEQQPKQEAKQETKKEEKKEDPKKELPEIPDEAINTATDQIMRETLVKDAHVKVDGNDIVLAIVVNAATNEETAKQYGDNFARLLSSMTAAFNKEADLESPSKDYIGGLWDHYNLQVVVASDPDNPIVQGAKVTSSPKITW